ncbi:Mannan endo-1,6-alpha-mannosidase DCW1 [Exophiala dermatitidis]
MKPFRRRSVRATIISAILLGQHVQAITLDLDSTDSIKSAAKTIAAEMVSYYTGYKPGDTPGNLPSPYYWWEAGAMFGALIDYYYFTGDDTYNNITTQAMLHQVGTDNDFMPANQTKTEGNDDQAFWGMAALSAAENKFPDPPSDEPQWLALAQAVFNTQAARWDNSSCGGGLKWQIFSFNNGYNYKNTISNGCFFNMASRLAVYTGNQTYADWAVKMWDWCSAIGLRDDNYNFYDGSDDTLNCTELDHLQWTYNAGTFLVGAANMYNYTNGSSEWKDRLNGIIGNLKIFLKNDVMYEQACETVGTCNIDQRSFKAYLARWMAAAAVKAPFTYSSLKPILEASAKAAAAVCTGGSNGTSCGLKWTTGSFDGSTGVGEQMSALEVIQSNLIDITSGPVTETTGGTSKGDPDAGTSSDIGPSDLNQEEVTTTDKAGAAIMTVLISFFVVGGAWWIII